MIQYENLRQIHVELSSNCNAACPNCPRNVEGGFEIPWLDKTTFSLGDFQQVFPGELLARLHRVLLCGNYGDPALCVDAPEIIQYIHTFNSHVSVRMHSNGGIRSTEWWANLAKSMTPNDVMIFSIDGLEDTNHLYRRNVRFDRLMENSKAFIAAGGHAIWEFLIFAHNEHQIETARAMSIEMGFKAFVPKKAFGFEFLGSSRPKMRVVDRKGKFDYFIEEPTDKDHQNKAIINKEDTVEDHKYDRNERDFLSQFQATQRKFRADKNLFDHLDSMQIDCMAARGQEIYVDANFGVHPCCFLGHASQNASTAPESVQYYDWLEKNVGHENINAKTHSIAEILASEYFDKIVQTWDKTHANGRLAICSKMCAKIVSPIENLYVRQE